MKKLICLSILVLFNSTSLFAQTGTVAFTGTDETNIGQILHDGIFSNDIPGIQLNVFGAMTDADATSRTNTGSFVFYSKEYMFMTHDQVIPIDVTTGNTIVEENNLPTVIVIMSNDGSEFSFQSIYITDYLFDNSQATSNFEGFKDNVSTGSVNLSVNGTSHEETFTLSDFSTSIFGNVDEVRITNVSGTKIKAGFNNISIGTAVTPAPTTQASNVGFSSTSASGTTISWTRGDGANCAVFMAATSSGTASPVDNSTYTANTAFGSGTQVGSSGWYCVYNGTGTSVSVSGLSLNTTYRVHVCEYNGGPGSEVYMTTTGTDNPDNVITADASVTFTDGSGFAPDITKGSTDQVLGRFQLAGDVAGASLTDASIQLNGTRTGLSNLKLWMSADAAFGSDTQLGATVTADPGDGSTATFASFTSAIGTSDVYYFLTGDVASDATGVVQGVLVNNSSLTIASGTLSGTITNAPLSNGDASLPVELVSFSATKKGNSVAVEWTTASETDNLGFIIERKTDKSDWQQIASYQSNNALVGKGTASSPKLYSYTDKDVTAGGSYTYRLSDVDVNGQVNALATTEVTAAVTPTTTQLFAAYPNPFNPQTTLKYQLANDSHVTLAVYDVLGRQVKQLVNQQQSAGEYAATWNGTTNAGLAAPSGAYLVRLQAGGRSQLQKIILMK